MTDPTVIALRAYLASKKNNNKENEMTITENNGETFNYSAADIERIKTEARNEGFNTGKRAGLDGYKHKLAESIAAYAQEFDLCNDGVQRFCEDNDIPFKSEHDVTVTITFTVHGILDETDVENVVDDYARVITELGFIERNTNYVTIDNENYNVEVS